jgi:hypothetical protein
MMKNKDAVGQWRNKKNGKMYVVIDIVEDQTNGREGTPMVLYFPQDNAHLRHVRTLEEFKVKFTRFTGG